MLSLYCKRNISSTARNINLTSISSCVTKLIKSIDKKPTIICYQENWEILENKKIDTKVVVIEKMENICPTVLKPKFNSEIVIVRNCDKNFVYHCVKPNIFPNAKNIFMLSHPCEPEFFKCWYNLNESDTSKTRPNIFLSNNYETYKNRWASEMENVVILNDNNIKILNNKIIELENNVFKLDL